ncbi:MAG TPA: DUF3565 domain-containing protein [Gemmatimonadales bacterium]
MDRRITGFHQDAELHWVAELECGHQQHVRHDPPWQNRPWVVAEASRQERVGSFLGCPGCDLRAKDPGALTVQNPLVGLLDPYQDGRLQGLCHDGAVEAARRRAVPGAPRPNEG